MYWTACWKATVSCACESIPPTPNGYIEDLFGLCYLLGYSFMPRIRDLADQQHYRIERNAVYANLTGLFRGGVDADLIWE
jgi:TnpA family transposase